jgi:hypothetical protein
MKTTPALRWACYAIAAAATAAAMWQVDHRADDDTAAVLPVRPAQRGLGMPVAATRPAADADALALLKKRLDAAIGGSADPFSDGGTAAAPAAPTPAAAQQAAAAPAETPPPVVPFTYVGRWQEQGRTLVFLRAGDRVVSVSGPGPLEGNYVVEAIGNDSLTLKMPGGQSQVIAFAAPAAGAPAPVAGVQTTAASTSADALQEGN